ncbi:unnamed protein product, partial [marine sediment metagenome]
IKEYSKNPQDIGNYQEDEYFQKIRPVYKECLMFTFPFGPIFTCPGKFQI